MNTKIIIIKNAQVERELKIYLMYAKILLVIIIIIIIKIIVIIVVLYLKDII